MAQTFTPKSVLLIKLVLLALAAGTCVAGVTAYKALAPVGGPLSAEQPIPFSHKHHAGDDGIDCRYCHTAVEQSAFAGIPSAAICMTCHSQLFTDAAVLEPLRESVRSGTPIHWLRVHDLPDFVYFDHSIHVNKGVACATCHGPVDRMPQIRRVASLEMQWCVECHRAEARARHLDERRMTDCSTCHR